MRDALVPALRRISSRPEPGALGTMLGLFMLGADAGHDEVAAAFEATGVDGLLRLDAIEPSDEGRGRWRAKIDLRPHASDADAELWVASDLGAHQRPGVLRHDHVLGIGQASLTLAQTTIRPQVDLALDLGT